MTPQERKEIQEVVEELKSWASPFGLQQTISYLKQEKDIDEWSNMAYCVKKLEAMLEKART